jgi:uncharacterized membrane protein
MNGMKSQLSQGIKALALVLLGSAAIHMVIVFIQAILERDAHFVSPLFFYGLQEVFPAQVYSLSGVIIGWVLLSALFWIVYYCTENMEITISVKHRKPKQSDKLGERDVQRTKRQERDKDRQ